MTWITSHVAIGMWDEERPGNCNVLDLRDVPDHTSISPRVFEDSIRFIDSALQFPGNVYVHCIGGISRSPTVVAAWLARAHGMKAKEALDFIRLLRPQIEPHPSQVASLRLFLEESA